MQEILGQISDMKGMGNVPYALSKITEGLAHFKSKIPIPFSRHTWAW